MKNLEIKTKKMSLVNIDGRLTPAEMENIMAGSGCNSTTMGIVCGASVVLFFTPFFELAPAAAVACSYWAAANHCG